MKRSLTILTMLAIFGLSGALAQNMQSREYQKHMSFNNSTTNPFNVLNPKSTVYLLDSFYIWQYDSLTATWNTTLYGKTKDFLYNSNNDVTSETDYQLNGSTWTKLAIITYTYNLNNKISNELWQFWNGSSWTNDMEYIFVYNSNNQCTSDTIKIWSSGAWAENMAYTMTYTGNNMTSEIGKEWNGTTWINETQFTYTYNNSNECTGNLQQTWSGTAWVNANQNTYTYNSSGDQIGAVEKKWSGTAWVNSSNTIFYYNANNSMIASATRDWNDPATKINGGDSSYYFYQAANGINELQANKENVIAYPNPVSNHLTIEATQKATINILNTQGQFLETLLINGNITTIDVSNLANGMYVMEVKTAKGTEIKKFMKE